MTVRMLWLAAACAIVMACGGGTENTATPPATESPAAAEAHTEADANTVRIEEGMLRDLRITVDEVESRPGGEQITLLGELEVDQRAYAEVGVPDQARVTRLLVNAGQTVRRGQTLAELTSPELGQARAEYLSAEARVKLADAALERKRGLAAEKIVPLREVQEAESQAAEARQPCERRVPRSGPSASSRHPLTRPKRRPPSSSCARRSVDRSSNAALLLGRCSILQRRPFASETCQHCG